MPDGYLPMKVFQAKGILYALGYSFTEGEVNILLLYSNDGGIDWKPGSSAMLIPEAAPAFSTNSGSNQVVLYASHVKANDIDMAVPINIGVQDDWNQILPQENFSVWKNIIRRNDAPQ